MAERGQDTAGAARCARCAAVVEAGDLFCPECGQRLPRMAARRIEGNAVPTMNLADRPLPATPSTRPLPAAASSAASTSSPWAARLKRNLIDFGKITAVVLCLIMLVGLVGMITGKPTRTPSSRVVTSAAPQPTWSLAGELAGIDRMTETEKRRQGAAYVAVAQGMLREGDIEKAEAAALMAILYPGTLDSIEEMGFRLDGDQGVRYVGVRR